MLSWEEIEAEWSAVYDSWDLYSENRTNNHNSNQRVENAPLYKHTDVVALLTHCEKQVKQFMKENPEDVKELIDNYNNNNNNNNNNKASSKEQEEEEQQKAASFARLYQQHILKIQAPMVRCSRPPFRRLCRLWGTDLSYTHMILASSFVRNAAARHTDFTLYEVGGGEDKLVVQLAANSAVEAAQAAASLAPYCDAIDLNCGCPQRWAMQEQLGASLLQRPQVVAEMVSAIRNHVPSYTDARCCREAPSVLRGENNSHTIPCVVKMRVLAHDGGGSAHQQLQQTVSFARQLEAAGAAWLTVHARTPRCRSSAPVLWSAVQLLQEEVGIPVVVNGGVATPSDAVAAVLQCGGVGGVMAGNALLSNPACFDLATYEKQLQPPPQAEEGVEAFLETAERLSTMGPSAAEAAAALLQQQQQQWRAMLQPCWAAGRPLAGGASYMNANRTHTNPSGPQQQQATQAPHEPHLPATPNTTDNNNNTVNRYVNTSNMIPPPREVVSDYLRLALRCDTPYPIAVQHTLRMARLYLSPAERSAVALVRSNVGLLQLMQALGIYVEGGRDTLR